MPEVIVKAPKEKCRPDDPRDYGQEHLDMAALAKKRAPNMHFESEGEKRDYEKAVKANPNNHYGLPSHCMFAPLEIRSAMSSVQPARECQCGGCATRVDGYTCPRCNSYVEAKVI